MAKFNFILDHLAVEPADWAKWCDNSEPWLFSFGAQNYEEEVKVTAPNEANARKRLTAILPPNSTIAWPEFCNRCDGSMRYEVDVDGDTDHGSGCNHAPSMSAAKALCAGLRSCGEEWRWTYDEDENGERIAHRVQYEILEIGR